MYIRDSYLNFDNYTHSDGNTYGYGTFSLKQGTDWREPNANLPKIIVH